jgi:scyllo-inositol 2-dehydrogenase (NADP+)
VFHNRRWDWDFLTVKSIIQDGRIGRPVIVESSVCRYASPRSWRGQASAAGTILHDWGAHLIDQALQLKFGPCRRVTGWITPAPWSGIDSGGHGRIVMEFDDVIFQVENSRICHLERPRWSIIGTKGALVKFGVDPQEDALRAGSIDAATEPETHRARVVIEHAGTVSESIVETVRGSWDSYYANIADHIEGREPLAVTAEDGREVVRVLDAVCHSAEHHVVVEGRWGFEQARS